MQSEHLGLRGCLLLNLKFFRCTINLEGATICKLHFLWFNIYYTNIYLPTFCCSYLTFFWLIASGWPFRLDAFCSCGLQMAPIILADMKKILNSYVSCITSIEFTICFLFFVLLYFSYWCDGFFSFFLNFFSSSTTLIPVHWKELGSFKCTGTFHLSNQVSLYSVYVPTTKSTISNVEFLLFQVKPWSVKSSSYR